MLQTAKSGPLRQKPVCIDAIYGTAVRSSR
jgi:hypothetical protein